MGELSVFEYLVSPNPATEFLVAVAVASVALVVVVGLSLWWDR